VKPRALVLVALFANAACFRTVYTDLQPRGAPPPPESTESRSHHQNKDWQSYFLFGWIPGEKRIDAARLCGGDEHVARIETEQTWFQALTTTVILAAAWLGIYSPWRAAVICDHDPEAHG